MKNYYSYLYRTFKVIKSLLLTHFLKLKLPCIQVNLNNSNFGTFLSA